MHKILLSLVLAILALGLAAGESYRFLMISDTHFGSADSFYTGSDDKSRTKKDVNRADQAMPLYRAMFARMAGEKDMRFLIHGGDMIEGFAKDEAAHRAELEKAIALLKEYFKCPIHYVKGNHDARGIGGEEAFRAVLLREISRTEGRELAEANYSFRYGGDLFVCVDYSTKWYKFLEDTLAGLREKPRYVFLVIHFNVIPFVSKQMVAAAKLLAKYDSVILCGHSHANMILRYRRESGDVSQLTVGTILRPRKADNRFRRVDGNLAEFKKKFRAQRLKRPEQEKLFDAEFEPYLYGYRSARGAQGYAMLAVSDSGIKAVFQSADPKQSPVEFVIKDHKDEVRKK